MRCLYAKPQSLYVRCVICNLQLLLVVTQIHWKNKEHYHSHIKCHSAMSVVKCSHNAPHTITTHYVPKGTTQRTAEMRPSFNLFRNNVCGVCHEPALT